MDKFRIYDLLCVLCHRNLFAFGNIFSLYQRTDRSELTWSLKYGKTSCEYVSSFLYITERYTVKPLIRIYSLRYQPGLVLNCYRN